MIVAFLTNEQAEIIKGYEYQPNCFCSPSKDGSDRYFITEDLAETLVTEFEWVSELPRQEYLKPIIDLPNV
jgi:hypothetical protein